MSTSVTGTERIRVCATAELPLEDVRVVDVHGHRVAVFHTDEGFFAIDDRCTHQDAALSDGFLEGCEVECPLHASKFDLRTGAVDAPPATVPVHTYPTAVEQDIVFVEFAGGAGR